MILKIKRGLLDNVIFILGIILIVIIAAIVLISQHNKVTDSLTNSDLTLKLSQEQDKILSFRQQVAEKALFYSFEKIAGEYLVDPLQECLLQTKDSKTYVIFDNEFCSLNKNYIKERFLEHFKDYFERNYDLYKSSYDISEQKQEFAYIFSDNSTILNITSKYPVVLNNFAYEMINYEITYEFYPGLEVSLTELSLQEVFEAYDLINEKLEECSSSETPEDCFDLSLKTWIPFILIEENEYVYLTLISEKQVFFEETLSSIELRFCFKL